MPSLPPYEDPWASRPSVGPRRRAASGPTPNVRPRPQSLPAADRSHPKPLSIVDDAANPGDSQQTATAPTAADRYSAATYGGQAVGATGPDATQPGSNPYAVQQTAITRTAIAADSNAASRAACRRAGTAVRRLRPAANCDDAADRAAPRRRKFCHRRNTQCPAARPTTVIRPATAIRSTAPIRPRQVLAPDPNITPLDPQMRNPADVSGDADRSRSRRIPTASSTSTSGCSEAQTGRLMVGAAVNSDAGLMGQILLDEQNFDWTRLPDELGRLRQRPRLARRRAAVPHRSRARYRSAALLGQLQRAVSVGHASQPRLERLVLRSPLPRLRRATDRRARLARLQWTENDLSAVVSYRGENVNIRNISAQIPDLTEVLGSNALHGFKLTHRQRHARQRVPGHARPFDPARTGAGDRQLRLSARDPRRPAVLSASRAARPLRPARADCILARRLHRQQHADLRATSLPAASRRCAASISAARRPWSRACRSVASSVDQHARVPVPAHGRRHDARRRVHRLRHRHARLRRSTTSASRPASACGSPCRRWARPRSRSTSPSRSLKADFDDEQVFSFFIGLQR